MDGLNYITTYSVEEFKAKFHCTQIFVKLGKDNRLYFCYGCNIGFVAVKGIPQIPVISLVVNSTGKLFLLLHEKEDIGRTSFEENIKLNPPKQHTPKKVYHKTSFWDYENEKMNDYDNWSNPYGDELAYYDGWSREDVDSGLADAYENELSTQALW